MAGEVEVSLCMVRDPMPVSIRVRDTVAGAVATATPMDSREWSS